VGGGSCCSWLVCVSNSMCVSSIFFEMIESMMLLCVMSVVCQYCVYFLVCDWGVMFVVWHHTLFCCCCVVNVRYVVCS